MAANPNATLDRLIATALAAGRSVDEYGPRDGSGRVSVHLSAVDDEIQVMLRRTPTGRLGFHKALWYQTPDQARPARLRSLRATLALLHPDTGPGPVPALADLLASGRATTTVTVICDPQDRPLLPPVVHYRPAQD